MSKINAHIFNGPPPSRPGVWLSVKNKATNEPAEILITGQIGKDWWSDDGVAEKEFKDALAAIPLDREIVIGINSEGGEIKAGLGIYNALQQRRDKVTVRVDGYAVSIASIIALAGKRTISPKSSIWMIHEPWTFASGNAGDFTRAAEMLEQHAEMLVDIYAEHTGKSREDIRAAMKKETWLRGSEALDFGLCDECSEDGHEPQAAFDVTRFKNVPDYVKNFAAPRNGTTQPTAAARGQNTNLMNKAEIIAALKLRGDEVDESQSEEQLKAQLLSAPKAKATTTASTAAAATTQPQATQTAGTPDTVVVDLRNELQQIRAERDAEKKARAAERKANIQARIQVFADEGRIDANKVETWTTQALVSPEAETFVLAELASRPVIQIGAAPTAGLEVSESPKDLARGFDNYSRAVRAWQKGSISGEAALKDISASSVARAQLFAKHGNEIRGYVMNTNTVPTGLKRNVILQTVIVDFARRTMPLRLFSTVFSNVPLEGTNKVEVPFYDLDSSATRSWDASTGYTRVGNTVTDVREITVGTGATNGDRAFQDLSFTSEEIARQPYLKIEQLARLKVDKLASDVVADVLSVITAANFGAAAITRAAAGFTSDDLADLKVACKLWPQMGRGLVLDSLYDAALLKDTSFKHALNAASDSAIKEGRLFPRVFGFDYTENPTIPENGENLVGFAVFQSAIGVATAPVPPVQEVRNAGTTYEVFTDAASGASFEYRTFGDNVLDAGVHVAEVSYGFEKLNGNALKRIVRP